MLLLHELKVPLLIVSAGISDVVAETLRSRDLLLDNITICANKMVFDEHGRLYDFSEATPVTSRCDVGGTCCGDWSNSLTFNSTDDETLSILLV